MGKSSPSPPAAPDPVAAAGAQSKYNKDAALYQSSLNNVNQITPYGNLTYSLGTRDGTGGTGTGAGASSATGTNSGSYFMRQDRNNSNPLPGVTRYGISQDGTHIIDANTGMVVTNPNTIQNAINSGQIGQYGNSGAGAAGSSSSSTSGSSSNPSMSGLPQWSSTISLSPQEQAIFDEQMANQKQSGALAGGALSQYQSAASTPIDYSKFTAIPGMGDLGGAEQRAMQAQMDLINPSLQQQDDALQTRMMNQGLSPGSQAWDNSYREFNGLKAQTMDNATLNAQQFATGDLNNALSARDQQINEALQSRSVPLNEYQALMGGSQVTNPQFSGPQNNSVGAPNYLQALQNQYQGQLNAYNANASSNNSMMGGLFGLGGSLLGNSGLFGAGAGLGGGGVAGDAFGMLLGL